ncbi:hypothetical protein KJ678_03305 [Patescibacteria group bacterium]|nr:hypothetical protein [Patescibacteria group bacterium]
MSENLWEKIENLKKGHKLDLSSDEDLSIAVMNLVSLEEHFFFTAAKTGKEKYYDLLGKVREIRKELLKKIVKDAEGEVWCISKHLLAASMRLIEVGTKYHDQDKKKEAQELFSKAYDLYSLFWGINLGVIDLGQVKEINDNQINKDDENKDALTKRLNKLVQDLIDCCEE